MPTPCPSRLKELIALANLEPDSEARKNLQAIARAFRAKRLKKTYSESLEIECRFIISISIESGELETGFDEAIGKFVRALNRVEFEGGLGRIRECLKCLEIFWAPRNDKETCSQKACKQYADALRKRNKRQRDEQKRAEKEKKLAKRKEKPLQWSKRSNTTKAVISAIMNQNRVFWRIDGWVVSELKWQLKAPIVSRRIVRQCLDSLVREDFLTYHPHPQDEDSDEERDPLEDRWAPTQKLRNRLAGIRPKKPTH